MTQVSDPVVNVSTNNDFHSTTLSAGYSDAGTLGGNCPTSGIKEHTAVQMTDKTHYPKKALTWFK